MTDRADEWVDNDGCCKTCLGELPLGHTSTCDYWVSQQHVARLQAELERVRGERDGHLIVCDRLRKDANRYLWLRDTLHWSREVPKQFTGTLVRGVRVANFYNGSVAGVDYMEGCGEALDKLIDAKGTLP